MKTIVVPEKLLKIPSPWNITSDSIRSKYVDALDTNKQNIEKALSALELCLEVLSQVHMSQDEHLPEDIEYYWMFIAEMIGKKIPVLEEFDISCVEKVLYDNKIESISESMIEEAAESWIWSVPHDIAYSCIVWLRETMKNCQNLELVDKYLAIASHYWQSSIPDGLITSLVGASDTIAGRKAIPLLEEVEQNSQDKELADLARDFKRLMIDPSYG